MWESLWVFFGVVGRRRKMEGFWDFRVGGFSVSGEIVRWVRYRFMWVR